MPAGALAQEGLTILFPQLGPVYLDERHKDVLGRMEAAYAESITINQSFWGEADTDTRFHAGDQTLWNDLYGNLPANRRRQFNFNRIRRVINMISGYQRRNRKSTIVTPIENGDSLTADQFTKIFMWCDRQEGILETISEAFEGSLVTGMNLLHLWVDYRTDPVCGNLRVDNCSYNAFLIDPYFRKSDLSDCNFVWKRSFLTKREVVSLLPDQTDEVLSLMGNDTGTAKDGKFQFMPESYNYGMKNLLTYDEYYYRDYRTQKMLADTETGETMEWKSDDNDMLKLYLQTYPTVNVIEQEVPTCRLAIVVQGKVFYDGPQPNGLDAYPFVPVFAYYAPQMPYMPWRIQGVVRGLRDAQYLYNRRRIIELDILESQLTSGWVVPEDSLVNPKDVHLQGQGQTLFVKKGTSTAEIQKIQAPDIPPSMIQLSELLANEVMQISGVNEELLGSAMDDKAGVLSMLRQGAGLTTLQGLFDNLDRAQKLLGKIMLDYIQMAFTPGKVKKILEGQEPTEQFYNKAFGRYHCVVEEGLNTSTQKQMNFAQLLQLREVGVPIPDEQLLEAATIQNKSQLIEAITQRNQQAQQMQQAQSESAMQLQQAQMQLAKSQSEANEGLAVERQSRVMENFGIADQREAEARKADESAKLDRIKAYKELDSIDISHLRELIQMAHMIENQAATKQAAPQAPA